MATTTGEKIRRMRRAAGWSQEQLGRAMGHTQVWISQRERDLVPIPVRDVEDIAALLGYSAEMVVSKEIGGEVLRAIGAATPKQMEHVMLFLQAMDQADPKTVELIIAMVHHGIREAAAEERASG